MAAGEPHGLVHFGSYAMNVMRIEKGYKSWGSESTELTPIETRLERHNFEGEFIGKRPRSLAATRPSRCRWCSPC